MNKFFNISNKCGMDLSQTEELFHDLGHFAQNRFGFKKPPSLNLVSDVENGEKPLGKTAYYDPQERCITIYTDNRHTKDILRSLAHELVHHMQNELGMLDDDGYHGPGYAQKNKQMRNRESEAYEKGNLCMRDWEDGLKQSKPTIYNEWRIKTMSIKKWKNNELMENLSERFGFKMDLAQLNESSCGGKRKYEEELGDGKIDPDDDKEAGLKGANPNEIGRGDVAAEKGGARGSGKKEPANEVLGTDAKSIDDLEKNIEGLKKDIEAAKGKASPEKMKRMKASLEQMMGQLKKKQTANESKLRVAIRNLIRSELKRK